MFQSQIPMHMRNGRWMQQPYFVCGSGPRRMPGISTTCSGSPLFGSREVLSPADHTDNHGEHIGAAPTSTAGQPDTNHHCHASRPPAFLDPAFPRHMDSREDNRPFFQSPPAQGYSSIDEFIRSRRANTQQPPGASQPLDPSADRPGWTDHLQVPNERSAPGPGATAAGRDTDHTTQSAFTSAVPAGLPPTFGLPGSASRAPFGAPPTAGGIFGGGTFNIFDQLRAPPVEPIQQRNPQLIQETPSDFIRSLLHLNGTATVGGMPPPPGRGAFRPMDSAAAELGGVYRGGRGALDPGHAPPVTPLAPPSRLVDAVPGPSPHMGFSERYEGNRFLQSNMSANIPADKNCSLFVTGLPPDVTTSQLLAPISGMGRIFATHINPPEPAKGHPLSAAKIVFFERDAAHRFWRWANTHGFTVGGLRAHVIFNRIRSAESAEARNCSRVLMISGPPQYVNPHFLALFFKTKFVFQVDTVIQHGPDKDGEVTIEYRFGSYRCQAQAAKMALGREFGDIITTYWGPDPCA